MAKLSLAFIFICSTLSLAEIPPFLKVCGRRDPKLAECVRSSIEILKPKLIKGIPEMKIPTAEPFYLARIDLVDIPSFRATGKDVLLHGLSTFDLRDLKIDLPKKTFQLNLFFKKIWLTAKYDVNTRILVPIAGQGMIMIESFDTVADTVMKYKSVRHKGKEYIFFPSMKLKLSIGDYKSNFTSFDGPNSPLSIGINAALEHSHEELIGATLPNIEKAISGLVLNMTNTICSQFTYDELLPDRE